jgi:hypothetical protein
MGVQIYLIQPKDHQDDRSREMIAEFIASRQGFILMATSYGSLIAAFDEAHQSAISAHHLVEFVGGVTLNPDAPGAAALQHMFAENIAMQLADRGFTGHPNVTAKAASFPLGYRPMRWPSRFEEGGDEPQR